LDVSGSKLFNEDGRDIVKFCRALKVTVFCFSSTVVGLYCTVTTNCTAFRWKQLNVRVSIANDVRFNRASPVNQQQLFSYLFLLVTIGEMRP
jgi:hypothetical protein